MPGSSLWLIPPPNSALYKTLSTLITNTIPAIYPIAIPPRFSPHVTLTADTITASSGTETQQWLDKLSLPESISDLSVQVKEAQVGEIFFRKLTLRCEKNNGLQYLAAACRKAGTGSEEEEVEKWVGEVYAPHLSLLYSDLPQDEVKSKLDEVKAFIEQAKREDEKALNAIGAEIWLVPTFKDIDDWKPIARRKLDGVEWSWGS